MRIKNTFALGFGLLNVFISKRIIIDENTGEISVTTEATNNSCSDYQGLGPKNQLGEFTKNYTIKYIDVTNKLSDYYTTGKLFYYDVDKNFLGKITFTRNSNITIPNDNAVYIAFLLEGAQIESSSDTENFCELYTVVKPHYKNIKKQYKKENNQIFFRESLEGKITLLGEDYEKIKNANLETTLSFNVYQNNYLLATNIFNKTDCKFDNFKKSVELKITPKDAYTKLLESYDKTYDLMKFSISKEAVTLTKRSIIQIYIQGEDTITNYSSGAYWEDEVNESVNDPNTLINKYHFAEGPIFKEINLTGFDTPLALNTAFRMITDSDTWTGFYKGEQRFIKSQIKFEKVGNKDEVFSVPYNDKERALRIARALSNDFSSCVEPFIDQHETEYAFKLLYDIYEIKIYVDDRLKYKSDYYYGKDTTFTLKQDSSLYPMTAIEELSSPQKFNLGSMAIIEYKLWGRLLCDVAESTTHQQTFDLPYDDFATERSNFKKCIGLEFVSASGSSTSELVHFYQKEASSKEPTPWGINDYKMYFTPPYLLGTSLFPYPLAKSTWANTSLWVAFEQSLDKLSVETWCSKYYKTVEHKDCMEIGAVIKALLNKIDPLIKFESTAEYSDFFYGTTDLGYGNKNTKIYITQKSNVLKGEYDQAAQKAEITFEGIMNLLRDCFRCYWYIDENNKFRIEHIKYFMNGLSYDDSPEVQLNLVNKFDKFNKKPILYCQQELTYAKNDLNSRYEFAWADEVTEGMGDGFAVDVNSNYIQKDKTENINIEIASSDIDMMMFAPNKFSQDGFALMIAKNNKVQIVRNEYYDQRIPLYPVIVYTQNYDASFLSLFRHYLFDMPAKSIHSSIEGSDVRYNVVGIKRCMEHKVEYQAINIPNLYKLISTDIGEGYIDNMSMDIDTRLVTVTLTYEPS